MQEFKKLMLVSITVDITGMGQSYQAFCMLIVLYGYFILVSNLQPYKTDYLNVVSYYCEFAELCTFAFMMVFLRTSDNTVINNLIFVLLLLMKSLYLLRFVYYYAKFYYYVLLDTWTTIKNKLKKAPADENEIKEAEEDADSDKITSDAGSSKTGEPAKKRRRKIPTGALYRATTDMFDHQT